MKKLAIAVLAFLGIQAFAQGKDGQISFTEEQIAKLKANFGEDFPEKFASAFAKDPEKETPEAKEVIDGVIAHMQTQLTASANEQKRLSDLLASEKSAREKSDGIVTSQQKTIDLLTKKPEDEPPARGKAAEERNKPWIPTGKETHLFGIEQKFFAIDDAHPYNQRAAAAIAARHGISMTAPMHVTASIDYESLKSDLGDFYKVRKQEQIQSFIATLPSLRSIFPMESGYQDRAVLVNMFLEEFSQAGNESSDFDDVVKGGYKFEPEELRMFDVMFAYKFKDLKKIEKTWIGYLNREGSSTMKWSFIEYIMVETAKQLHNEQEQRWIRGVRINPTLNVPGTAMGASDGLLKFIKNKIAAFQIKPFALGEWTASTIAGYIKAGTQMIPAVWRDSGRIVLYMSDDTRSAYHSNLEALYGTNMDYTPDKMYVKEYPGVKIVVVPNMGSSKRLIWTIEGNISLFEDQPGEMLRFNFEQQDWSLKVWSSWKESTWAKLVGKKYSSAAEMPDDYSTQLIWTNDVDEPSSYYIPMAADDTTPSVANHTSLVSVANSQATAITDIDDSTVGQVIRLKCGPGTNPITIAKSGKFSLLSAAWQPEAGNILVLMKRSDGKFLELQRISEETDATVIAADDTTPDVASGVKFVTSANTQATAITDLDNAAYDTVYTILGGSDTNASTIANSGNFALTAAMELEAGTYIRLIKSRTDDKFYEIERG